MSYLEKLAPIVSGIIAPAAAETDKNSVFPRAALRALGEAGLLGLTCSREVGGLGLGLAEAAQVIERIAEACLTDPRVSLARVRVEKLEVLPGGATAGVEVERRRHG